MLMMMFIMIVAVIFAVQGVLMHAQISPNEARLHQLQKEYFTQQKSLRDSAATGSELNKTLVEIQQTPSDLLRLKLVGVGKMLTGIFVLLFGILIALIMMPIRLGKMINKNK